MKLGVCVPNYGESCSVEALRTVAAEAEKQGYDSIWCTDHVLMPKNSGPLREDLRERHNPRLSCRHNQQAETRNFVPHHTNEESRSRSQAARNDRQPE